MTYSMCGIVMKVWQTVSDSSTVNFGSSECLTTLWPIPKDFSFNNYNPTPPLDTYSKTKHLMAS